ncbi:hypothetical protein HDU98_009675 [Podochytrium sp. JEL0797]|nr:hypothetical protein HDU98_009675 [Podochytrium sp. JEL0797]
MEDPSQRFNSFISQVGSTYNLEKITPEKSDVMADLLANSSLDLEMGETAVESGDRRRSSGAEQFYRQYNDWWKEQHYCERDLEANMIPLEEDDVLSSSQDIPQTGLIHRLSNVLESFIPGFSGAKPETAQSQPLHPDEFTSNFKESASGFPDTRDTKGARSRQASVAHPPPKSVDLVAEEKEPEEDPVIFQREVNRRRSVLAVALQIDTAREALSMAIIITPVDVSPTSNPRPTHKVKYMGGMIATPVDSPNRSATSPNGQLSVINSASMSRQSSRKRLPTSTEIVIPKTPSMSDLIAPYEGTHGNLAGSVSTTAAGGIASEIDRSLIPISNLPKSETAQKYLHAFDMVGGAGRSVVGGSAGGMSAKKKEKRKRKEDAALDSFTKVVQMSAEMKQVGLDPSLASELDKDTLTMVVKLKKWAQARKKNNGNLKSEIMMRKLNASAQIELPKHLEVGLIEDVLPMVELYRKMYANQLGPNHKFSQSSAHHHEKLKERLQNEKCFNPEDDSVATKFRLSVFTESAKENPVEETTARSQRRSILSRNVSIKV